MLQRGDERQPDRLARHGHVRRIGLGDEGALRDRLDPGHLRARVQVGLERFLRGAEVHRQCAALTPLQRVDAHVRGDAVQPRTQRGTALEALEATPGTEQGLLHRVLCLERRAEHAVAVAGQLTPVLLQLILDRAGPNGRRRVPHRGQS